MVRTSARHLATQELRERLQRTRAKLLHTVTTTHDELATLGTLDDSRDIAVAGVTASTLLRLENHERRELEEIEAALARLESGRFGICEGCRTNISVVRLRAMPTARLCLACQARRER